MLIKSGGIQTVSTLDPATTAWVAAVIANGGTVSVPRQVLVDALIVGLRVDGLFTKLDRLWLFAAENEPSALTDIINGQLATAVGSPVFTADDGYAGGASKYIDANVDFTGGGFKYTQNDGAFFSWAFNSAQNPGAMVGTSNPAQNSRIYPRYTDDNCYWRCHNITGDFVIASTDAQGLWCASNVNTAKTLYRNGSLFDAQSQATNLSVDMFWLANSPTGVDWFTDICSCGGFGSNLSATDASNLYTRIRTYMTAIGVP